MLIKLNKDSDPKWQKKSIATLIEDGAKLQVEQKYKMGWLDIYLNKWSEHHIHPVSWGGSKGAGSNLQYLKNNEHTPITGWWTSRKSKLDKLLK